MAFDDEIDDNTGKRIKISDGEFQRKVSDAYSANREFLL